MNASKYLLDTNILSDVIKNPKGKVAKKIRQIGSSNIFTSVIVASELQFGIQKKTASELTRRVTGLLDTIQILDLKSPSDQYYGKVRNYLQKEGTPIGPNDLFIAAHALAENLILVTDNVNEFIRIPDLKLENWLE